MNFNKRQQTGDFRGDPYKRQRQEDPYNQLPPSGAFHHQGYAGDQMAYPSSQYPPPEHFPDHYAPEPAYHGTPDYDPYSEVGYDPYTNTEYGGYNEEPQTPHYNYSRVKRAFRGRADARGGRGVNRGGRGVNRGARGFNRGVRGFNRGVRGFDRGIRGGFRGRGGGVPDWDAPEQPATEIETTTVEFGEDFSCSRMGPIKALLKLYPDAEFRQTLCIQNELGHAHGFQVTVQGKDFYGEGSTTKIAKGLAALDALTYIEAPGCEDLQNVCDVYLEMKKIEAIKEVQERTAGSKKVKKGPGPNKFNRQAMPSSSNRLNIPPNPPILVNFNLLRQKYVGANNEGQLMQTFNPASEKDRTCVLIVQGHVFKGHGPTDKVARDKAAGEAIAYFEKNPPEFVQKIKEKVNKAKLRDPIYDREDPDDYENMLFCKAWKFVVEMTKDRNSTYTRKQNLAFVLKVYGSTRNIDNVEVVAMASGAKIINTEYMSSDGLAVNDCAAEPLCMRAFRRYLLNQLLNLCAGQNSIFRRNPFGRIMMKEGIKFIFLTNCSPMGDCKEFDSKFLNILRNSEVVKYGDFEPNTYMVSKPNLKINSEKSVFDPDNCGKIHLYRKMLGHHVPDQCVVPKPDNMVYLTNIASPSDKLALRNVVGVQGALLSTLIDNVYFPEFYAGRAYNEEAMVRGLYGRLRGSDFPPGVALRTPEVKRLTWKPSRMSDRTTIYAFVWCDGSSLEILRGDIGKVVETIKPEDTSSLSEDMEKAYDSREIKSASPSSYCTHKFYEGFTSLLTALNKPVDSYVNVKKSATAYQNGKQAVYRAFEKRGLGNWPKKMPKFAF